MKQRANHLRVVLMLSIVAWLALAGCNTANETGAIQPTEITQLTETVQPTKVEEPIETSQPTAAAEPTEVAQPTETAQRTATVQPTEGAEPTETTQPTAVIEPTETAQPTEAAQPTAEGTLDITNPASVNCRDQGGTLVIEERGDLGQIGVCVFDGNRQCEEWALMRGDCPVGGVRVTGYATEAGRFCAITGGVYAVTGESNADEQQSTCTFPDSSQCNAWDYYNGACNPGDSGPMHAWQTYINPVAGFSLQTPATWSQTRQPDSMAHGMAFDGPEGGVLVQWGEGFGGGCPPEWWLPLQLAQGEVQACHIANEDGTNAWNLIDYQVEGGNYFSNYAYTSNADPASRDVVLRVLSTLAFMPPVQSGATIQPLPMELCDDQAQAMAHVFNDMVPIMDELPLTDPVTGATGTGCMMLITGVGTQFPGLTAIVAQLGDMLAEQGFTEDPELQADGPMGTSAGYRKDDQMCQASASWTPLDIASCPSGVPIWTCAPEPEQRSYTISLVCGVVSN